MNKTAFEITFDAKEKSILEAYRHLCKYAIWQRRLAQVTLFVGEETERKPTLMRTTAFL